jgi:hypothetical protein
MSLWDDAFHLTSLPGSKLITRHTQRPFPWQALPSPDSCPFWIPYQIYCQRVSSKYFSSLPLPLLVLWGILGVGGGMGGEGERVLA